MLDFEGTANRLGKLLVEKNTQYGNSYIIVPNIMRELYPNGIRPHHPGSHHICPRNYSKVRQQYSP